MARPAHMKSVKAGGRDHRLDNLRCLLIFLVVLCHFLETTQFSRMRYFVYCLVYTFHMPAFVFLSGYFARFRPSKLLVRVVVPYVVFQIAYLFVQAALAESPTEPHIQFLWPCWIMWYLMALLWWHLLVPVLDLARSVPARLAVVAACIALALAVGFSELIAAKYAASRTLCFLPFFVAGHYLGDESHNRENNPSRGLTTLAMAASLALVVGLSWALFQSNPFTPAMLFQSGSYASASYGPLLRGALIAIGFVWIAFLYLWTPNIQLPLVTDIGMHTMPVYLFHGLICLLVRTWFDGSIPVWVALAFAIVIPLCVGNKYVGGALDTVLFGGWLSKLRSQRAEEAQELEVASGSTARRDDF